MLDKAPSDAAAQGSLPEQGYSGKDVEHKDMDTYTEDFGKEYGPNCHGCPQKRKKAPPKSSKASSHAASML